MAYKVISGPGGDIQEPDWEMLIPDQDDGGVIAGFWRDAAHQEWVRVTAALREAGTLAPENRHQIQRLVIAYIRYDIAAMHVMQSGAVTKAKRTSVPMLNLWQTEMRAADSDATTAERELGITPRQRGAVTKAKRNEKKSGAADAYLAQAPRKTI